MGRAFAVGVAFLVVSSLAVIGTTTTVVSAETGQREPQLTLIGANVSVEVRENRLVDATYRFETARSDSGSYPLTTVEGTMWRFPERDIRDLRVSVDGVAVSPDVTTRARHLRVSVPVPESARAGVVVVRVRYTVSGPEGRLRLPLWGPSASTPGDDRVVDVTVRLPDGTRAQSAAFPAVEPQENDVTVLAVQLPQMPGFVALEYGQEPPVLTLDDAVSLTGVGTLAGLGALWAVFRSRDGADVD
jgi:hypothetical protein